MASIIAFILANFSTIISILTAIVNLLKGAPSPTGAAAALPQAIKDVGASGNMDALHAWHKEHCTGVACSTEPKPL